MKKYTILFQGDSITDCGRGLATTAGYYQHGLGPGYPALIAARLMTDQLETDWQFVNRGISGQNIYQLYARWRGDALEHHPDMLSMLIGVNDAAHENNTDHGPDPLDYGTVYRTLLGWCRKENPDIRFVLLEPFRLEYNGKGVTDALRQRQSTLRQVASEFDAVFIPLQQLFDEACKKREVTYWSHDGVHPSLAGHQLIADAWLKSIKF